MDDPLDDLLASPRPCKLRIACEEVSHIALAAIARMRQLTRITKLPPLPSLHTKNSFPTEKSGNGGLTSNFNNHTGIPPLSLSPSGKYRITHLTL